jgi:hypothetical protein
MDVPRSLEQLDGEPWGEAPPGATGLVEDVYRLRRVPVRDLSNGDLRLLLGQKIGAEWLIPLALDRLDDDPVAGDWYPGDLLRAVLYAGTDYWPTHPDEVMRLWAVRESLDKLRADAAALLDQPDWPAFG